MRAIKYEQKLETYEQAMAFFDLDPSVADDFVPTMYSLKVLYTDPYMDCLSSGTNADAQTRLKTTLQA